jgi:hypothetical protein
MRYSIRRTVVLSACLAVLAALPGYAQAPAPANPTAMSDQAIGDYIDAHAAVTKLERIPRWELAVCPVVTGLAPTFIKFIAQHIRDVARAAGASVDADPNCKANIDIAFTTQPQPLLDNIHAKTPMVLGYFENSEESDRLAKIVRPIQAWYVTETMDLRNQGVVDNRYNVGRPQNSTGGRLGDGLRSAFYHVLIVADPGKLGDFEMGVLADYIALVALSQPATAETCTDLPGILNVTRAGCHAGAVKAMTAADTAYLRGLYKTTLGANLRVQKGEIAVEMKNALAGH